MIYTRYTSNSNCIEMFTIIHYFYALVLVALRSNSK